MYELKQNTSGNVFVRLVDSTDFVSAETGITSPTIRISKNGGSPVTITDWNEVHSTYMPGLYRIQLSSTDTNTAGTLSVSVTKTGCLPVVVVVLVVEKVESDLIAQLPITASGVFSAATSAAYDTGSFGRNINLARMLLTNRTKDMGSYFELYDDNGIALGTFSWTDYDRGKFAYY